MKHIIGLCLAFIITTLSAQIEIPKPHVSIMLDAKFYGSDNANGGTYDTTNRFQVRKAELAFEGKLSERIEYALALGMCTCSGSGSAVDIQEAGVYYNVLENLQVGIQKGHTLRGFAAMTECSNRLSSEKPNFIKSFSDCHPLGAIVNYNWEINDLTALETEVAIANGVNGTMDGEHDYNCGMVFHTPISGLSLTGLYNHTGKIYYDTTYNPYSETGYRYGGGLEYMQKGWCLSAEYQSGKGFEREEQEMTAWYAQAGYEVQTGLNLIPAIQPYAFFENWDKDVDTEQVYQFMEAGCIFKTSKDSNIRMSYKINNSRPDGTAKEPNLFLIRIQASL